MILLFENCNREFYVNLNKVIYIFIQDNSIIFCYDTNNNDDNKISFDKREYIKSFSDESEMLSYIFYKNKK